MSDLPTPPAANPFGEILDLIAAARQRAYQAVNTALIDLYWQVGEHISRKIASAEWGDGVVEELAGRIAATYHGLRGFTRSNLLRMRQFYQTYRDHEFVAPLVRLFSETQAHQPPVKREEIVVALLRQLPWTHHITLNRTLSPALIAEYQTQLPDKQLLRAKLHEFYLLQQPVEEGQP